MWSIIAMSDDKEFLTIKEAATHLRVCSRTINNYIKDRTIPHIKLGKRTLIRRKGIEALLKKLETPAK